MYSIQISGSRSNWLRKISSACIILRSNNDLLIISNASHLSKSAPELPTSSTLGLLSVDQKLQNGRFHIGFGHVIIDVAKCVIYIA